MNQNIFSKDMAVRFVGYVAVYAILATGVLIYYNCLTTIMFVLYY